MRYVKYELFFRLYIFDNSAKIISYKNLFELETSNLIFSNFLLAEPEISNDLVQKNIITKIQCTNFYDHMLVYRYNVSRILLVQLIFTSCMSNLHPAKFFEFF